VSGDAGLVGRHELRTRLRRAAEAAIAGRGQVVLLTSAGSAPAVSGRRDR
jgi:hypothetical protein